MKKTRLWFDEKFAAEALLRQGRDDAAVARAAALLDARIAEQNDAFRRHVCLGSPLPAGMPPLAGRFVCTAAVAARGELFVQTCRRTTGFHTEFPPESDPNGLHEFGAFQICGTSVWWKIDAYDRAYEYGSEDPGDPDATARVLTVLFPSDW